MKGFVKETIFFVKAVLHGFKNAETEALIFLLVLVLGTGTLVYNTLEGWSFLDSFYFSVMTLTTVGYGDLTPVTDIGKLFTIGYVFVGLILILGFINSIVRQTMEDRTLEQAIEEKEFYKEIKKVKK